MLRYASWIANAALFTVCCFLVANTANAVFSAMLVGPSGEAAAAPAARPATAKSWKDREVILSRNLFNASLLAPQRPVEPEPEVLEATKLPLALLGTAACAPPAVEPGCSYAVVQDKQKQWAALREACQRLLPQVKGVSLVRVSATSGKGLDALMRAVLEADETWNRRVPTHKLNQWLGIAVEAHPPPAVTGRRVKLRYITQANARPPTFVVFCSLPKALPDAYVRYLVNGLRETFDLPGVPIRLNLRKGDNPYVKGGR